MGTKTSKFGTSKRESHDSSSFYNRKLYYKRDDQDKKSLDKKNSFPKKHLNQIYQADSRSLGSIPDNSLHLMITSPPYNVGKVYDDNLSLEQYLNLIKSVMNEVYRVLVPGGRACINIANLGRKPYIPVNSFVSQIMIETGFLMRGEIIWDKAASAGGSCAWGSWQSASNPVLRDVHEYILIYSKETFTRIDKRSKKSSINKDEFLDFTKSIWRFNAESAKRVNHPAPFPLELPYRLIQLYSFEDDIVLDPFCGSGTTCIAALKTKRNFIGVDNNSDYVANAKSRVAHYIANEKSH